MSIGIAITLYLIGIIVGTIVFGVVARKKSLDLDEDDASLFFVLISLWPISLLFGTIGGAIFFLFYKPIVFLLFKSGDWCDGIVNWLKSKKEQQPNSKDEGV